MALEFLSTVQNAATNVVGAVERFLDNGRGISLLRSVDWDRRYLWIAEFEKGEQEPPAPFNEWFPAATVDINNRSIAGEEFTFGQTKLYIPTSSDTASTISVTFYDDVNRTLYRWLTDWMQLDIQNNGQFVSGLRDDHQCVDFDSFGQIRNVQPVRTLNIILLKLDRSNFSVFRYAVVPSGDLPRNLSQGSEAVEFTMTFHIVGEKAATSGGVDTSISEKVKDLLGRVI